MKVFVYVEGPSDKLGMEALLQPLIQKKGQAGVAIRFFESPKGDRKVSVLTKVPVRAANILLNDPHSMVVALPDLYPRNKGFPHETADELVDGVVENFRRALRTKGARDDSRVLNRFRVFCFKYDLEALLLASEDGLRRQLGVTSLNPQWRLPVEDQDHGHPPKRIVDDLFTKHGKHYIATLHVPLILRASHYQDLAKRCPQWFGRFVTFLANL